MKGYIAISACLVLFLLAPLPGEQQPRAKVIALAGQRKEQPLLSGPPETVSMRSGLITLQPDQTVGKHSTGHHEEMLVILAGEGKMLFSDGSAVAISKDHVLYCPPQTENDVMNTGHGVLRYIYVVASTDLK